MTHFLPDPARYTTANGVYSYRGKLCKLRMRSASGGKTQSWKVYTEVETGHPVGYVAQAISLFGSHYDVYVLNIDEFVPEALPGVWQLPSICDSIGLQNDPYPANTWNLLLPAKATDGVPGPGGKFSHMKAREWLRTVTRDITAMRHLRDTRRDEILDLCTPWSPKGAELPVNFSWRDSPGVVGPPRDQVACGSCWAFATAEIIESAVARKTGQFREISTNRVMDCTFDNMTLLPAAPQKERPCVCRGGPFIDLRAPSVNTQSLHKNWTEKPAVMTGMAEEPSAALPPLDPGDGPRHGTRTLNGTLRCAGFRGGVARTAAHVRRDVIRLDSRVGRGRGAGGRAPGGCPVWTRDGFGAAQGGRCACPGAFGSGVGGF